jgi:hypothetical protein
MLNELRQRPQQASKTISKHDKRVRFSLPQILITSVIVIEVRDELARSSEWTDTNKTSNSTIPDNNFSNSSRVYYTREPAGI